VHAGLRHDNLHEPVSGSRTSPPFQHDNEKTEESMQSSSRGCHNRNWKRTASCPWNLKDPASINLVKPEYSKRNHKEFLDLYTMGAVLGTGGYAVVRECTNKATGMKYAAKMMTVSEHPESGGREIAKQVHFLFFHQLAN
jgi:hypothetical protein